MVSFGMGRPRCIAAGEIVHPILHRANRQVRIFHKPADDGAFPRIMSEGLERIPCRRLGPWALSFP
jgi:hypothetical protein